MPPPGHNSSNTEESKIRYDHNKKLAFKEREAVENSRLIIGLLNITMIKTHSLLAAANLYLQ